MEFYTRRRQRQPASLQIFRSTSTSPNDATQCPQSPRPGPAHAHHSSSSSRLDVGWVQHDSHGSTKGLWRQVLLEVGSHNTVVAVGSGDLAPDDSDLGASDFLLGSVDVGNSLTQVESGVLGVANALDLDQRRAWVVHVLGTLVGQVLTLNVQSVRFSHGG